MILRVFVKVIYFLGCVALIFITVGLCAALGQNPREVDMLSFSQLLIVPASLFVAALVGRCISGPIPRK